MNSKKLKKLRKTLGNSWSARRYIVNSLRPKADVPPVPKDMTGSHHNIRVGVDKEGNPTFFPVVNPITLHPESGRALYKRMKKLLTKRR